MSDSLLNKTRCRIYTMDMIAAKRSHLKDKKRLVSESYYDRLEARLRAIIVSEVETMPTPGATIK